MARPGVGAGGGSAPSRAKRGSFFTGGRYLMHEKVFLFRTGDAYMYMDINTLNNPRPHRISDL